jgi:O-antigen/teichoic acid export membrane protein
LGRDHVLSAAISSSNQPEKIMASFLSRFFPLAIVGVALAEEAKDLPPQTSGSGVVLFLVLFVGICVGFYAYLWWKEKPKRPKQEHRK